MTRPWKIGILTTSRADFSIYQSTLRTLDASPLFDMGLLVTGMHMSEDFGMTVKNVEASNWPIWASYPCLISDDSAMGVGQSMGKATQETAKALAQQDMDILMVLGDRYEMAAAALAAVPRGLPLVHLHGGEETEGAMDNVLRHMITKLSHLHCCTTELSAKRIRQMGEPAKNVIVSGAPALDNIASVPRLSRVQLEEKFGILATHNFSLMTYHPVTLDMEATETEMTALFDAIIETGIRAVFTAANADTAGRALNAKIEAFVESHPEQMLIGHMGAQGYYSAMEHADMMIGNSSSGILEAASFGLPVINIGDRQKGRERSRNVIDVTGNVERIKSAIEKAHDPEFATLCSQKFNIYGQGNAAEKILDGLIDFMGRYSGPQKSFHLMS